MGRLKTSLVFICLLIFSYIVYTQTKIDIENNNNVNTQLTIECDNEKTSFEEIDSGWLLQESGCTVHGTALVLLKKKYINSDYLDNKIVPYDIVFSWNSLGNIDFLDIVSIRQNGRWFFYNWDSSKDIQHLNLLEMDNFHIANTNMIFENDNGLMQKIKKLKAGDYVKIEGTLINIKKGRFFRNSSLNFSDRSSTSCEQLLITDLTLL